MCHLTGPLKTTALIALAAGCTIAGATIAGAAEDDSRAQRNAYVVAPLVSNVAGGATVQDTVLQNAWGVAFSPAGSPFWVNDNGTGCSTLYSGAGTKLALQVSIPLPGNVVPAASCHPVDPNNPPNPAPATPTGIVWNPSTAFLVPGTKLPAVFIFATEDGTVSAWAGGLNPADNAVIAVDNSSSPAAGNGAVYKGLVFGLRAKGGFLYATNFRAGTIDVFGPTGSDGLFTPATTDGGFADPNIPAGYAPFGIANIDGDLFVTYAKQNAEKRDDVAGPGRGFVDVFDTEGHLLRRFASRGPLNSPWGLAMAPANFGRFSGDLLVGNFGDGRIHGFHKSEDGSWEKHGVMKGTDRTPIVIDGLWGIGFGNGANAGPTNTLFFAAGPDDETHGLFGSITAP